MINITLSFIIKIFPKQICYNVLKNILLDGIETCGRVLNLFKRKAESFFEAIDIFKEKLKLSEAGGASTEG